MCITTPAASDVTILYERGPCLVVLKPPGVLTQAPPGIDSMESRIKRFLQQREDKQHNLYLGIPHRLDRPVSGALVVARHVRAARRLSEQFEGRLVEKRYWALVAGNSPLKPIAGTWTDFMRKVADEPRSEIVDSAAAGAQSAILQYQLQAAAQNVFWLAITLQTGRTHQIRLQAAHHGVAILGDELYGSTVPFGPPSVDARQRWIALHARRLGFRDPMTQAEVIIDAPLTDAWKCFPFDFDRPAVG